MNVQRGKGLAVAAMLLCVCYVGYRQYEGRLEAASLRETTGGTSGFEGGHYPPNVIVLVLV